MDMKTARIKWLREAGLAGKSYPGDAGLDGFEAGFKAGAQQIPFIREYSKQRDEVTDALRELVWLKDLKTSCGEFKGIHPDSNVKYWELFREYERRQPLAWAAARAAVAKVPTYTQRLKNICEGIGINYEEVFGGR